MPTHRITASSGRSTVIRHSIDAVEFVDAQSVGDRLALAVAAAPNEALPAAWQEALAEHAMVVDQSIVPRLTGAPMAQELAPQPKVEVAAAPPPGHTLLLAVQTGEVMQWFVPVNAGRLLPVHADVLRATDTVTVPDGALRFLVPSALLASPSAIRAANATELAGGILGVVMHLVRVPLVRDLVDGPLSRLIEFIINHVDTKPEGFRFLDPGRRAAILTEADLRTLRDRRVLVLVHGIFSNVEAFNQIATGPTMAHLQTIYGDAMIGWDHRTVAKSPLDNADDMLSALPPGIKPDFICHSRGALVVRAALEHARLQAKRETRFHSVGTGLFVAGANQGSQLATYRHVNDLLNIYSAIASIPALGSVGIALGVLVGLLKVLAHAASIIPAVKALSTDDDNEFLRDLDRPFHTSIGQILVTRANYDPANDVLLEALNLNVDVIFGSANDLVVPFVGATQFDEGVRVDFDLPFGSDETSQSTVMHTNFFAQQPVQQLIVDRFA